MAYLRKEVKKYGTYISLVHAYRDKNGKAQQRRLANLGNINNYSKKSLRNIARSLYALGDGNPDDLGETSLEEIGRYNYGFCQVYAKILKRYELDKVLNRIGRKHKLSYNLVQVVLLMLIERLNEPASKRTNYLNQDEYLGLEYPVKLEQLYRSLDLLDRYSELIQQQIFKKGRDLFNLDLDVVFYDVTTLYFESQKEQPGSLRQKGFGKDGKIGDTQIVFSLLIDKNQQPVGYEIFEGNKYEGHTLSTALDRLKSKYNIRKIIVVADRGMLSQDNIKQITKCDYDYIIGERLKSLPKQLVNYLTDLKHYKPLDTTEYRDDSSDQLLYTQIEYKDRTIVATYSKKRARKDIHDRDQKIAKALELLKTPSKIKGKISRRYLKTKVKNNTYQLDEQKIERDQKFDGLLAISTSVSNLKPNQIIAQYCQLFKIEKSFRTIKHHLAVRPIFHWTNSRIKGHLCMAFIAYTLLNHLIESMSYAGFNVTENQLRSTIGKMQLSLVKINEQTQIFMRSKPQTIASQISKVLKIKALPNYLSPDSLKSYL